MISTIRVWSSRTNSRSTGNTDAPAVAFPTIWNRGHQATLFCTSRILVECQDVASAHPIRSPGATAVTATLMADRSAGVAGDHVRRGARVTVDARPVRAGVRGAMPGYHGGARPQWTVYQNRVAGPFLVLFFSRALDCARCRQRPRAPPLEPSARWLAAPGFRGGAWGVRGLVDALHSRSFASIQAAGFLGACSRPTVPMALPDDPPPSA